MLGSDTTAISPSRTPVSAPPSDATRDGDRRRVVHSDSPSPDPRKLLRDWRVALQEIGTDPNKEAPGLAGVHLDVLRSCFETMRRTSA